MVPFSPDQDNEKEKVYSLWEHNNTDGEMERLEAKNRRRRRGRGSECFYWKASMHENSCIVFSQNHGAEEWQLQTWTSDKHRHTIKRYMWGLCLQTKTEHARTDTHNVVRGRRRKDTNPSRGWKRDHSKQRVKLSLNTEQKTGRRRVAGTIVTVR